MKDEKAFDALLKFCEDNTELIAEGLDLIVKKMVEDGVFPTSGGKD